MRTQDYTKKQEVARVIESYANTEKNNAFFEVAFAELGKMIQKVAALNIFASEVAKTADKSMNPYGLKVANISSKQAWILACAIVENGLAEEELKEVEAAEKEEVAKKERKSAKVAEKKAMKREIAKKVAESEAIVAGDEVSHPMFGNGKVTEANAQFVAVLFDCGEKKLSAQFSKLTKNA